MMRNNLSKKTPKVHWSYWYRIPSSVSPSRSDPRWATRFSWRGSKRPLDHYATPGRLTNALRGRFAWHRWLTGPAIDVNSYPVCGPSYQKQCLVKVKKSVPTCTGWHPPHSPVCSTRGRRPASCGCRRAGRKSSAWCGSGHESCRGCGAAGTGDNNNNGWRHLTLPYWQHGRQHHFLTWNLHDNIILACMQQTSYQQVNSKDNKRKENKWMFVRNIVFTNEHVKDKPDKFFFLNDSS